MTPTAPDPRIDGYIAKSGPFAQPILHHLRALVHASCPGAVETIKWGAPAFTWRGKVLCLMAAFKQHATLSIWGGASIIQQAGAAKAGDCAAEVAPKQAASAMGQFGRITCVADLPEESVLTGYLRQATKLIDSGAKIPATRSGKPKPPLQVPSDLLQALGRDPKAKATFDAFPTGHKREYVEWLEQAKREQTRSRRLAQAVEWLAEGKPRNWKYMNC